MKILAIDTTTDACSVAIWDYGTIYTQFEECPRTHTRRILSLIKIILSRSNVNISELDALAFCRGPGNFTGMRVSIGVVQGLALSISAPVIGISTLATIAQGAWRKIGATKVVVATNARVGELYWAEYTRDQYGIWNGEKTEKILKYDAVTQHLKKLLGNWVAVGDGWQLWNKKMGNIKSNIIDHNIDILFPEAEDMLPIALRLLSAGHAVSVERAKLIYLHNELAWKKHITYK